MCIRGIDEDGQKDGYTCSRSDYVYKGTDVYRASEWARAMSDPSKSASLVEEVPKTTALMCRR